MEFNALVCRRSKRKREKSDQIYCRLSFGNRGNDKNFNCSLSRSSSMFNEPYDVYCLQLVASFIASRPNSDNIRKWIGIEFDNWLIQFHFMRGQSMQHIVFVTIRNRPRRRLALLASVSLQHDAWAMLGTVRHIHVRMLWMNAKMPTARLIRFDREQNIKSIYLQWNCVDLPLHLRLWLIDEETYVFVVCIRRPVSMERDCHLYSWKKTFLLRKEKCYNETMTHIILNGVVTT